MKLQFLKMSVFTVTLEALKDVGFKGFNLQAREIGGDVPVGTFKITDPNTKGLECHNVMVCVQSLEQLLKLGFLLNTLIRTDKTSEYFLYGKVISSVDFKNFYFLKKYMYLLYVV